MIRRVLALVNLLIVLNVFQCLGQFTRTYGHEFGNNANSILRNSSGNFIVAGWYDVTEMFTAEFFLMELAPLGDTIWTKTYGTELDTLANKNGSGNEGFEVIECSEGGYLFVGEVHEFGPGLYDPYFVRTNEVGDTIWTHTYGTTSKDVTYSVCQLADSSFVGVGYTEGISQGAKDALVIKLESNGDTLWTKSIGTSSIDGALDVIETPDNHILVLGYSYGYWGADSDVWLAKLDNVSGEVIWEKIYGGYGHDFAQSIILSGDSMYTIVGSTESFGAGISDAMMFQVDTQGNYLNGVAYGGNDRESFYDVEQTSNGFSFLGYTRSFGAGWEDIILVRTDYFGDTLFSKSYGYVVSDFGRDHVFYQDEYYLIGQTLNFGAGSSDIIFLKTDSDGNGSCTTYNASVNVLSISLNDTTVASNEMRGLRVKRTPTLVGKTRIQQSNPCSIIGTNQNQSQPYELVIFPNPTSGFFSILNGEEYEYLSIHDVYGKQVYHAKNEGFTNMNPNLSSGVYIVSSMKKGRNRLQQTKLMVE